VIVAYYVLLTAPRWRPAMRSLPEVPFGWVARFGPIAALGLLLLSPMIPSSSEDTGPPPMAVATFEPPGLTPKPAPEAPLRITLLSIGAGQVAVVQPPAGGAWFIDAGSTNVPDLYRRCIDPFLRSQGIGNIAGILLSHGDYDHISAAAEIAADTAAPIYLSPHFRRHADGVPPAEALLDRLEQAGTPPIVVSRGDRLAMGGATAEILWPPKNCPLSSNNCGIVLKLTYAARSVLFPADIQDDGFFGVLQHADELRADALIAPHHGSFEALTKMFIEAVQPRIVLASNDVRLTRKQKNFDELVSGTPLYRTSRYGAITLTIRGDGGMYINTHNGQGPTSRKESERFSRSIGLGSR
jgi:competence protein ComEC